MDYFKKQVCLYLEPNFHRASNDELGRNYYVGIFKDDLYHGQGKLIWKNGESYVGAWENGERHGYGSLLAENGSIIYQGNWQNGEREEA